MSRTLFDLTGRVALVTGSSRGLGMVMARGLAEAGTEVILNGGDAERQNECCQENDALHVWSFLFDGGDVLVD